MPLTGPIPEGRPFFCPHCGALYSVTDAPRPKGDNATAKCVVCTRTMVEWASTESRVYKLIHRPEDA
jgi:transcription elongation factor Elf1